MSQQNEVHRGNTFVENDRESIENEINEGHSVFRIRANTFILVEEISGQGAGNMWDWQTFYVSRPQYDNLSADDVKRDHADDLVGQYYNGQQENGVVDIQWESIHIHSVEKYDNNNIANLPLRGETYKTRAIKGLNDIQILTKNGHCLFEYLLHKIINHPGFHDYNRKKLLEEFEGNTVLTINDIVTWIKKGTKKGNYDKNISLYAWFENGRLAYKFTSNNRHENTLLLFFVISDDHCEPVENDRFTAKGVRDLRNLVKNFKEVEADTNWKFDSHFNNYYFVDEDEFDENQESILKGTYKSQYEALIFEIRRDIENPDDDIEIIKVGNDVMMTTKHKLSFIDLKRGIFKHPTSRKHQNYVFCKDFNKRKEACEYLFNKTNNINFKFNNQSWGEISLVLIDYYLNNNQKWASTFTPRVQSLVDDLCCKPLVQGLHDWENMGKYKLVV